MAELGRRDVVADPLGFNPREVAPDRSLQTMGVRNPMQTAGDQVFKQAYQGLAALGPLRDAAAQVVAARADDAVADGKLMYMQGKSYADAAATGDVHTQEGYNQLDSIDQANRWYLQEKQNVADNNYAMDPDQYREHLMQSRSEALKNMPTDPTAKKLYVASFDDLGPRLAAEQFDAHNQYQKSQNTTKLSSSLYSHGAADQNATRVMPSSDLRVSPGIVSKPVQVYSDEDLDILTKTMLGEASGEGDGGMAAVGQVIINRSRDGRFPSSIKDVALQPSQFSAWNTGPNAGGNNPNQWKPGMPAYDHAMVIAKQVLDGHVVDITGGATHYFAPGGMGGKEPDWFQPMAKQDGAIKIGNHIFTGGQQASMPTDGPRGKLVFAHGDQTNIQPQLKDTLELTAGDLGLKELPITSGFRSTAHPVEAAKIAAGGEGGEHTHGDAADIDMSGMTDDQRTQLVQTLRARGGRRFITYTNQPNMLHVDLKDQNGDGSTWFMYDKSHDNLGKAPAWFQTVANSPAPRAGREVQTSTQNLLTSSNVGNDVKVSAAADAMIRSLADGTDQTFNDLGGFGTLSQLGADIGTMDKVQKAKDAFDKKQLDKWDVDTERTRNEIELGVKTGKYNSFDDILKDINQEVLNKRMSTQDAKALARSAADQFNQYQKDDTKRIPIAMHTELTALYKQIDNRSITPEDAASQSEAIGKKYGIDKDVVSGLVGDMFTKREAADKSFAAKQQENLKKYQTSNDKKDRINTALSQGSGLSLIDGNVLDENGKEVPARQYAVDMLESRERQNILQLQQSGKLSKESAGAQYYKNVYEALAKQGVVDERFASQIHGAISGRITNKAGTGINDDARDAFDFYMQAANNPNIGPDYLAKMIPDSYDRSLLKQASLWYGGQYNIDDALLKAHEQLQRKDFNPDERIQMDSGYTKKLQTGVTDALTKAMTRPGFFGTVQQTPVDAQQILKNNGPAVQFVQSQADIYHSQFPMEDPEVSISKAVEDLGKNLTVVGGNMLIGRSDLHQRLDQVMGLEGQDPTLPAQAINETVKRLGPTFFGELWNKSSAKSITGVLTSSLHDVTSGTVTHEAMPPYYAQYNPASGVMSVQLWDSPARKSLVGSPMYINVKASGARMLEELRKPTTTANAVRYVKEQVASGMKQATDYADTMPPEVPVGYQ